MRPSRTLGFAFLIISLTLCAALTPAQQNQITAPQQVRRHELAAGPRRGGGGEVC